MKRLFNRTVATIATLGCILTGSAEFEILRAHEIIEESTVVSETPAEAQAASTELESLTAELLQANEAVELASGQSRQLSFVRGGAILIPARSSSNLKSSLTKTVEIARKRYHALEDRLKKDQAVDILKVAIPERLKNKFPKEVQPYLETETTPEGEFELLCAETGVGPSKFFYSIKTKEGQRFGLHFAGKQPQENELKSLKTGARIRIKGVQVGEELAVEAADGSIQVLAAPAVSNTFGEQKTIVFLIAFQNAPSATSASISQARDVVFNASTSASNYFKEASYNQTWLTGDVVGPLVIPQNSTGSCDYWGIATSAEQAATQAGIQFSSYKRKVYAFPSNNCPWWGLGTVGGNPSMAWVNGSFQNGVVSHEMGHNLGLYHSHALECGSVTLGGTCNSVEYGDTFDVMGSASPPKHFNAPQKERLGWLNYLNSPPITTVTANGSYTISPYETPATTPLALKFKTPTNDWYYIEFRQPIGFDSAPIIANTNVKNGTLIHLVDNGTANSMYLLDMTPETSSWSDPALTSGKSFVDVPSNIQIRTESTSPAGATVNITLGSAGTCIRQNPGISVSPIGQYGTPGQALTYNITIVNNDSPACGSSTFSLVGQGLPVAWTMPGISVSVAAGSSNIGSVVVTSPPNAPLGAQNFTLKATNTADATRTVTSLSLAYSVQNVDTQAPSIPKNLSATAVSNSQINLSWQASTDDVAVAGYKIFRGTTEIGVSTSPSYQDTALNPSTTYMYSVAAYDAAGNISAQSASVSATTLTPSDSAPPTKPTGLKATPVSTSQITLTWNPSTDNVGVTGYKIMRGNNFSTTVSSTSYHDTGLTEATTYSYKVYAFDAAGNESAASTISVKTAGSAAPVISSITSNPTDVDPSTSGIQFFAGTSVTYIATASDPDGDPLTYFWSYKVNGGSETLLLSGLNTKNAVFSYPLSSAGSTYQWILRVNDGHQTTMKTLDVSIIAKADKTPPSVPNELSVQAVSASRVELSWYASQDAVGVTGYKIYRDGTQIGNTASLSYQDNGLAALTKYSYTVAAYDAAGNISKNSTSKSAITFALPPTGSFIDDFNRADSANPGHNWQPISGGGFNIKNNELHNNGDFRESSALISNISAANITVTGSFASISSNVTPVFGVILRYQDPKNYYLFYRQSGGSSYMKISKIVDGNEIVLKQVGIGNPTRNSFFRLGAQAQGNVLTLTVNGVRKLQVTDNTFGKGRAGITVRSGSNAKKSWVSQRINHVIATTY